MSEDQPTNLGEDTKEQETNTTVEDNDQVSDCNDGSSIYHIAAPHLKHPEKQRVKREHFNQPQN